MKDYSYQLNGNYYVALDTLNDRFREMSYGTHQWLAVPVQGIFLAPGEQPRSCALVGYSNPDGTTLPNHLCYLFPAVALAGHLESDPKLIVQLEPGWMPALSRGLYCDEGNIKSDFLEDFFRVWPPLKQCLGLVDDADGIDGHDIKHESGSEDIRIEDAQACREALEAHMMWLAQCTETIQEAVSDDSDPGDFFAHLAKLCKPRRKSEQ